MTRRAAIWIGLLAACLAVPATAAGTRSASAPVQAASDGKVPATATRATGAAKAAAARPSGAAKPQAGPAAAIAGAKSQAGPAAGLAAPRRLDDIHIEGEIPAPQVLFVTARDQRRFTRFHHQRYLKTGLRVGEEAPLPARIATTGNPTPGSAGR